MADTDAHTALASSAAEPAGDDYSPATAAAEAWRHAALCHIAEVLSAVRKYRRQAEALRARGEGQGGDLKDLHWGQARGFQVASLGPAVFLAERAVRVWPELGQEEWESLMRSGEPQDLLDTLKDLNLATNEGLVTESDDDEEVDEEDMDSCLSLAQRNYLQTPNPQVDMDRTSLSDPLASKWAPLRTESLPYDLFPPGMRWFGPGAGVDPRPVVVHANGVAGDEKEALLRKHGLWALGGDEEKGWTCDAKVMREA